MEIYFNINVNDNEIDDMNNKVAVHSIYDLLDDGYSNIEDHENQHKQTKPNQTKPNQTKPNQTIVFILLLITNYNQASSYKIQMKLMIEKLQSIMKMN